MHNLLGFDLFVFKLYIICIKDSSSNDKNGNFGGEIIYPIFLFFKLFVIFSQAGYAEINQALCNCAGLCRNIQNVSLRSLELKHGSDYQLVLKSDHHTYHI